MEIFLIKALQLILCFSLLVLLHEGGHFFFAKLFGVRVEKFCLFFDPWFSWKICKFKGTEYHIGWLPLGGYVKIAGMVDESMDTEQLKQPVQADEFRAKSALQRLLIMVGGVLVNFLTALALYAMILFVWGDTYTPVENMKHGFKFSTEARKLGFRDGDIPLTTDFGRVERFNGDFLRDLSKTKSVTVLRNGRETQLSMPGDLNLLDMLKHQPPFVAPLAPSDIDSVLAGGPAARAGVKAGDRLLAFDGETISSWNEFNEIVARRADVLATGTAADSARLRHTTLVVQHAGSERTDTLALHLTERYELGIFKHNPLADYEQRTLHYSLLASIPAGVAHGWDVLCGYVDDLKYLFTKDGASSVGSFGTIGNLFPATWDWLRFWELTAFISLMLAFMNILPIPALDGGHILFLLVEVVTRRKPSEKFLEKAQMVGMYLLLALMALAVFNDFRNLLF